LTPFIEKAHPEYKQLRRNSMSEKKEFVNGLIVKAPHEKAPSFVKANISIKREELIEWLNSQQGDWVNVDIKESQGGKWYAEVNDWKPEGTRVGGQGERGDAPHEGDGEQDLPF
jgi:hypothetical protein